jgi:hypothetical protein
VTPVTGIADDAAVSADEHSAGYGGGRARLGRVAGALLFGLLFGNTRRQTRRTPWDAASDCGAMRSRDNSARWQEYSYAFGAS